MAKKRKRRADAAPAETVDYTDADGNVLALRESVSAGTVAKLAEPAGGAAASADDMWRRRTEMLFERFAVRWVIADLPLRGRRSCSRATAWPTTTRSAGCGRRSTTILRGTSRSCCT